MRRAVMQRRRGLERGSELGTGASLSSVCVGRLCGQPGASWVGEKGTGLTLAPGSVFYMLKVEQLSS